MTAHRNLPTDVEADQVWRAPDGQHYRVAAVENGLATLQRCTAGGRVLNASYSVKEDVERMQATFKRVGGA